MKTLIDWIANGSKKNSHLSFNDFKIDHFNPPITTQLLILQPTPFCNLDCSYCYLPDRNSKSKLTLETIEKTITNLKTDQLLGSDLTVVWHAGEPLVMQPEFYEKAFQKISEQIGDTCRISHSIQTNATLIDEQWCDLFRKFQVNIGISIDGPQQIHDLHRKTRTGNGSFEQVMNGINLLKSHQIPFHVISVITAETLAYADELKDFYLSLGVTDVGFNFDEAEGIHSKSSLLGNERAHEDFLQAMLNHVISSQGKYFIRELTTAQNLITRGLESYTWQNHSFPVNVQTIPFALVTVGWNGDFSTFSPELLGQPSVQFDNFVLGNVHTSGFLQSTNNPVFKTLWRQIMEGVNACQSACEYFNYCGGGAPANKYYENNRINSTETLYCRSMMIRPFEVVLRKLEICLFQYKH